MGEATKLEIPELYLLPYGKSNRSNMYQGE